MFDIIKKSYEMAGSYKKFLRIGALFIFIQHISVLMQFVAMYLGFLWLGELDKNRVVILFLIVTASLLLNCAGGYGQYRSISGSFLGIFRKYREDVGEKLKNAPMGYFTQTALSHILDALTLVVKTVEQMLGIAYMFIFTGIAVCIFLLLGLFGMHVIIGLFALGIVALAWICLFFMYFLSRKEVHLLHDRSIAYSEALVDGIRGIPVLRSFPKMDPEVKEEIHERVNKTSQEIVDNQVKLEFKVIIFFRLYGTLLYLGSLGVTLLTYYLYLQGQVELPKALTLCAAGFMLFGGMKQLENVTILGAKTPHEMDYLNTIADIPQIKDGPIQDQEGDIDLEFSHLSFSYDGDREILKGLNFKIPAKKKVAIIGPSGAGKTTVIHLIARFYDPTKGAIRLGGHDLREYEVKTLLSYYSLVFQEVYLFHDTIINNIRMAKPDATDEEVIMAAKRARCHEFIMEFPDQYQTNVGEEGSRLSGGERQRISIARALLKDAPIILLDEATSSVDPENEGEILKAIDELTRDKTVISIAHRLSTVRDADDILVLDHGKLVQQGNHEKLIKEEGLYKNFIKAREEAQNWDLRI
ncbi:MAG: ABC transporter ATP-binding protein [Tissierellia bacterium]|nr:ABC transporter ATP-binding protein [Tissierellia bacterium]